MVTRRSVKCKNSAVPATSIREVWGEEGSPAMMQSRVESDIAVDFGANFLGGAMAVAVRISYTTPAASRSGDSGSVWLFIL